MADKDVCMTESEPTTSDLLKIILSRLVDIESKFVILNRKVSDVQILQRRNAEKVMKSIGACQKGFLMTCEQIYAQREEVSEFAGNCIDNENRVRFV